MVGIQSLIEGCATFTLANCVLVDNQIVFGSSALWVDGASGVLLHSTIARNQGGADVEVNSSFATSVTITNAIVVSHSVDVQASEVAAYRWCQAKCQHYLVSSKRNTANLFPSLK